MTSLKQPLLIALTCLISSCNVATIQAADTGQPPTIPPVLQGNSHRLTYLGKEEIPAFEIDGLPARVHTQGIYLTKKSLYVTGRLERTPKRAFFFRFDRDNLSHVEFLDITPSPSKKQGIKTGQDHPGGFDYDGKSFWIPVAVSRPHSSTTVIRVHTPIDALLADAVSELAFVVDDHIGALAVDQKNGSVIGANWNTKVIWQWNTDGTIREQTPREKLFPGHPNWGLAVQDWKYLANGTILASGYDKDPCRDKTKSRAVLDWLDIRQHKLLDRIRIIGPDRGSDSLTREGMALFNSELFLLPGDLGDSAILYRYRIETIAE